MVVVVAAVAVEVRVAVVAGRGAVVVSTSSTYLLVSPIKGSPNVDPKIL